MALEPLRNLKSSNAIKTFETELKHDYLGVEETRKLLLDNILRKVEDEARNWGLEPRVSVENNDILKERILRIDFYVENWYAVDLSDKIVKYCEERINKKIENHMEAKMEAFKYLTNSPVKSLYISSETKSLDETFEYVLSPKFAMDLARALQDKIYETEKFIEKLFKNYRK